MPQNSPQRFWINISSTSLRISYGNFLERWKPSLKGTPNWGPVGKTGSFKGKWKGHERHAWCKTRRLVFFHKQLKPKSSSKRHLAADQEICELWIHILLLEKLVLLNLSSKSIMPKNLHQFYVWNLQGAPECSNEKVTLKPITKPPKLLKPILMEQPPEFQDLQDNIRA